MSTDLCAGFHGQGPPPSLGPPPLQISSGQRPPCLGQEQALGFNGCKATTFQQLQVKCMASKLYLIIMCLLQQLQSRLAAKAFKRQDQSAVSVGLNQVPKFETFISRAACSVDDGLVSNGSVKASLSVMFKSIITDMKMNE
jgi:hypothetical protein